jgi:hypothetical protein
MYCDVVQGEACAGFEARVAREDRRLSLCVDTLDDRGQHRRSAGLGPFVAALSKPAQTLVAALLGIGHETFISARGSTPEAAAAGGESRSRERQRADGGRQRVWDVA